MLESLGMDWDSPLSVVSEYARFIRGVNWAGTELGPPHEWPALLHQMVDLVLADPAPASVMWGDRLTMIYNPHFVEFAGSKHPNLMGGTPIVEYAEVWDTMFADIIKRGREKGEATRHKDVRLFLHRHGYLEEVYATYTFVPILGADKSVVGFYHTAIETTDRVLAARRAKTLLSLGDHATSARSLSKYWETALMGFESNYQDVPYAVAYSFKDSLDKDSLSSVASSNNVSSTSSGLRFPRSCTLAGALRRPVTGLPMSFDTTDDQDSFVARVQECTRHGQPLLLETRTGTLPEWLHDTEDQGATHTSAVVVPIRPTKRNDKEGANAIGFLIIGLNPHRTYDQEYEQFVHLCSRQLATSAASVMLLVQEVLRQKQLAEQLSITAKNQKQSETRFRRFAELADVAIWIVDASGMVTYANKAWQEQTGLSQPLPDLSSWMSAVTDDCRLSVERAWNTMIETKSPQVFECQLSSAWSTVDSSTKETLSGARWVLCSAFPDLADDGSLQGIWACNTDISHQKWAEALKEERVSDLLEAKRQSENFIDMVSHEMRNPLSAIMQCADGISSTIREAQSRENGVNIFDQSSAESMLELAQTIVFCAQHQTRIVNDILTLSRLDSSLLTVSLIATDPVSTLTHALKLHQQELLSSKIDSIVCVEDSYRSNSVDRVFLDPSRLLQLLINLISNAIKFTRPQTKRIITLRLGASQSNPDDETNNTQYFRPRSRTTLPQTSFEEEESEKELFLLFSVEDTGCGLAEDEIDRLFMRFSQASPRTHVQYGGSGLGLFICKELVELCGGRIGVTSRPGKGSTFKFFLPVRRAPPEETTTRTTGGGTVATSPGQMSSNTTALANVKLNDGETSKDSFIPQTLGPSLKTNGVKSATVDAKTFTTDMNKIHVLVVEDNLINQRIMAKQLRKEGCVVHVANHGADALTFLRTTICFGDSGESAIPLSIILLDLEMPVMDGLTCVRKIRKLQETGELTRPVPVLAVTANARPEQVQKAMDAGMDDIVTKPVRIPYLIEQMRRWVGKESL